MHVLTPDSNCNDSTAVELLSKPSYRPVIFVHGLMTGDVSTMVHLATRIEELHPGTKTYVIDRFCGLASLEPLWRQVRMLADDLLYVCSLHPEGVHVIGYSQGGLISRGMLQAFHSRHNVRTFVSLSSPQGGQYGSKCFSRLFPGLTVRAAYQLFYTRIGQHSLSVANYWNDPRHKDLYLKYSAYLAVIDRQRPVGDAYRRQVAADGGDEKPAVEKRVLTSLAQLEVAATRVIEDNEPPVDTADDSNDSLQNCDAPEPIDLGGLDQLHRLVMIGGPDDGVISPWQSSHFGVLDQNGDVVPLRKRTDIYGTDDPIGLRKLNSTGRLIQYAVPGVGHHQWHCNEKVLRECILDWLD